MKEKEGQLQEAIKEAEEALAQAKTRLVQVVVIAMQWWW